MQTIAENAIGNRIRDARIHIGWTQEQLASAIGVSKFVVHRLETGERKARVDELAAIGRVLNLPSFLAETCATCPVGRQRWITRSHAA